MEIIIEIGDEVTQQQIKEELDGFLIIAESMEPPLNISRILVPLDFQRKVRELIENDEYKSQRGLDNAQITVAAKTIDTKDGTVIVINPFLYLSSAIDAMIRCFILTHEFTHVMNKSRFPKIPKNSFALKIYLENLYNLFDEYIADRISFYMTEKLFSESTEAWKLYNKDSVLSHINPASHLLYRAQIKSEIENFKIHRDFGLYWESIIEPMNTVSISTVHGFASYHQHYNEYKNLKIPNTAFLNEKTLILMDYLKVKHENYETDLSDGIDLITNYVTNFGIKFEDHPSYEGYIRVLDI